MVIISVSDLSIVFDGLSIRNAFNLPRRERFEALKINNMEIGDGEIVAVLGHNGAGKSTLLNTIAGKIRPKRGKVTVDGTLVHLSGVNPGFDVNLSARQNISWLSKIYNSEPEKIVGIVEGFSQIGEAFDRPIRNLSGGMRGRVGFGFATSLNPDILLIDEVLGVGDPSFKQKATAKLKKLITSTGTVLISTHSVGLVKEIATRTVVLRDGSVIHDGGVLEGLSLYAEIN